MANKRRKAGGYYYKQDCDLVRERSLRVVDGLSDLLDVASTPATRRKITAMIREMTAISEAGKRLEDYAK